MKRTLNRNSVHWAHFELYFNILIFDSEIFCSSSLKIKSCSLMLSVCCMVGDLQGTGFCCISFISWAFSCKLLHWCSVAEGVMRYSSFRPECCRLTRLAGCWRVNMNSQNPVVCVSWQEKGCEQKGYVSSVIPSGKIPGKSLHKWKPPAKSKLNPKHSKEFTRNSISLLAGFQNL